MYATVSYIRPHSGACVERPKNLTENDRYTPTPQASGTRYRYDNSFGVSNVVLRTA
jgi:hypothetical protein